MDTSARTQRIGWLAYTSPPFGWRAAWRSWQWRSVVVLFAALLGHPMDAAAAKRPLTRKMTPYVPMSFAELPGWAADQHAAAFVAFLKSCERLIVLARTDSKAKADDALLELCVKAGQLSGSRSSAEARAFFEQYFVPHRVAHQGGKGLLTAYYEPIVAGSRAPTARFGWPLYKRPADLVTIVDEANRGTVQNSLTHARQTAKGLAPFATRAEIEQGALKGKNLELLYVEHAVDAFFMQIQGSARVKLPDGSTIRIGYDGKNGHPYTSIGRVLIDQGQIPVERMSLQALQAWLKANAAKAREVMWANKSFVFFKEHAAKEASGPQGVHDITLTPGRSLAIDPSYHALGLPIFVAAPEIKHISVAIGAKPNSSLRVTAAFARETALAGFHRLMIAQDVGSAIKGPERGDIYVGTGDAAGKIAGITKHPGNFFVLLPKSRSAGARPSTVAPAASVPVTAAPMAKAAVAAPQPAPERIKPDPAEASIRATLIAPAVPAGGSTAPVGGGTTGRPAARIFGDGTPPNESSPGGKPASARPAAKSAPDGVSVADPLPTSTQ